MVPAARWFRDAAANVFTHPSPAGYRPVAMIGCHVPRRPGTTPGPELRLLAYGQPKPEVSRALPAGLAARGRLAADTEQLASRPGLPCPVYPATYPAVGENVTVSYQNSKMRTKQELELLRERAVTLRRQGRSLRQIKQILGPMSNVTLNDALRGVPPPDWTVRPNAKDEQRAKARELRAQGMDYEEIAAALGVAQSSVSLWVRDLPRPARLSYAECRQRSAEGARRYWAAERPVREARRAADRAAAVTDPVLPAIP